MDLKEFVCNCQKCNKEYIVLTTEELFNAGKYRKTCSSACAKGRKLTDEQRKRISEGVKLSIKFQMYNQNKYKNIKKVCPYCNEEYEENGLKYHIIYCKKNPNGKTKSDSSRYYTFRDGSKIDKTYFEINEYLNTHKTCEICGKTVEESVVNKENKFMPKRLCIDHDHNTNKFRGVLCSRCNRQLGWYELYRDNIYNYLNKRSDTDSSSVGTAK